MSSSTHLLNYNFKTQFLELQNCVCWIDLCLFIFCDSEPLLKIIPLSFWCWIGTDLGDYIHILSRLADLRYWSSCRLQSHHSDSRMNKMATILQKAFSNEYSARKIRYFDYNSAGVCSVDLIRWWFGTKQAKSQYIKNADLETPCLIALANNKLHGAARF